MTTEPLASRIIARVADDYRRRGYDVEVAPSGSRLPQFLAGFSPDLIARNARESVVVEVKVGTRTSAAERLREVAERVSREPGWRLSLVFVNPDQPDQISEAEPAPLSLSQERVRNADTLIQSGQAEAAFLLLWSALEGILRFLGHRAHLPLDTLPPSALIRELYSAGEISADQFELLLQLLPVRNQLAHGLGSGQDVDVEGLHSLVHALLADAVSAEP